MMMMMMMMMMMIEQLYWDTVHNKQSATIRNLKLEWWGAPLVQEENKYQVKGNQ